jgi:hypothetical protein
MNNPLEMVVFFENQQKKGGLPLPCLIDYQMVLMSPQTGLRKLQPGKPVFAKKSYLNSKPGFRWI